jgi:peptide/nickel transport system permease protein
MGRYLARRLGFLALTLLFTSVIVFVMTQLVPGDIARIILGREAGEAALQNLREKLGLNDPVPVQYARWLGRFVTGDWGESFSLRAEIRPFVLARLRNSLMLALITLLLAVPLGIALGVLAGLRENRPIDTLISVLTLSVVGLPEFVTGLVLIQLLAHRWKLLPASSSISPDASPWEALPYLVLPALTATLVLLAYIVRHTRTGVVEELKKPYTRTAVLKGLPRHTVLGKHVLQNALLPTITVIAISFGWLIGGIIVIENVFNYPGLGRLLVFAIQHKDIPLLQSITMVIVVGVVLANLAADLLYAYLNPRIRLR